MAGPRDRFGPVPSVPRRCRERSGRAALDRRGPFRRRSQGDESPPRLYQVVVSETPGAKAPSARFGNSFGVVEALLGILAGFILATLAVSIYAAASEHGRHASQYGEDVVSLIGLWTGLLAATVVASRLAARAPRPPLAVRGRRYIDEQPGEVVTRSRCGARLGACCGTSGSSCGHGPTSPSGSWPGLPPSTFSCRSSRPRCSLSSTTCTRGSAIRPRA